MPAENTTRIARRVASGCELQCDSYQIRAPPSTSSRKCPLESIFEFAKIAAANQSLGPGQVNNLVDLGMNNRGA